MQELTGDYFPAPSSGAIAQALRVTLNSSGQWTAAGATTLEVATLTRDAFASQTTIPVSGRLASSPGIRPMVANGTIATMTPVYTAASGKISQVDNRTSGGFYRGISLAAAGADGDIIPVLNHGIAPLS